MNDLSMIQSGGQPFKLDAARMPLGLALYFDDAIYKRVRSVALEMSEAVGFTPKHLIKKPEACVAVITRAMIWNLDPQSVAASTYMTSQDEFAKIGYEGKLIHAILEASGRFDGAITCEHFGNWDAIRGKWKTATSQRGKEYAVQDWKPSDEDGLGVTIRGQIKKEVQPREFTLYLRECYPRLSSQWALRPSMQIIYTAMRAFANIACPAIMMGVNFDVDERPGDYARDVTSAAEAPTRAAFAGAAPAPAAAPRIERSADLPIVEPDLDSRRDLDPMPTKDALAEAAGADTQTGELPAEEVQEMGPADTYDMGAEAKRRGASMFPPSSEAAHWTDAMIDSFKAGWRAEEEAMKSGSK